MEHTTHSDHPHQHGASCSHTKVRHAGHVDYLHDGHLHATHESHVDEHRLEVSRDNPEGCTPSHACDDHDADHKHGSACGHEMVPHGDHRDYLVGGHLHYTHQSHCDDHGALPTA